MRGSINRNSVDNLGNHGGYQLHGDNSNHNRADLLVLLNPELSGSTVYTQINTAPVTETAFVDTGVLGGQSYDYEVESVDASGVKSAPSNMAAVTIP